MTPFPFNTNLFSTFPLSSIPYNSRVTGNNITTSQKNHVMIGFRPGFPLQAAELNEIQETILFNDTLTCTMNGYWSKGDKALPGWFGSIPLWPNKDVEGNVPTTNMFYLENITGTSNTIKFTATPGWYYVYMPTSCLRHWVYITGGSGNIVSSEIEPQGSDQYVGFMVQYTSVSAFQDGTLYDNSSTNPASDTSPAGANRVKVNVQTSSLQITNNLNFSSNGYFFSPIAKINSTFTNKAVYLNNRDVPINS